MIQMGDKAKPIVTAKADGAYYKIEIDGLAHLKIKKREYQGFQTWIRQKKNWLF